MTLQIEVYPYPQASYRFRGEPKKSRYRGGTGPENSLGPESVAVGRCWKLVAEGASAVGLLPGLFSGPVEIPHDPA